jgi:hypothetical protein
MGKNDLNEFSEVAADGSAEDGLEAAAPEAEAGGSDKAAENAAAQKMNEIFGRNDRKNQADELEEEGLQGPDNPDGDELPEEDAAIVAEEEEEVKALEAAGEQKTTEQLAAEKTLAAFDPNLKAIAKELGGWAEQDIDDFIVSNPVLARVTFARIQAGYNTLSQQYARGVQAPAAAPQQSQAVATSGASPDVLNELLSNPKKLADLQEALGKDVMEGFVKPLLQAQTRANEDRAFIDGMRKEALVRDINETFTEIGGGIFADFYGKNGEVSQKQSENRFQVAQLADQIQAGAKLQNVQLSVRDALKRAHRIVTADQSAKVARQEVRSQVKKRSANLTARPTARKTTLSPNGRSDEAALAAVADFWSESGRE